MASTTIRSNSDAVTVIQGSNNPLVVEFDEPATFPSLSVSLWDNSGKQNTPVKKWDLDSMTVDGNRVICGLTEPETSRFPIAGMALEIKAVDENGYTIFWERFPVNVMPRYDRSIRMTGGE